MAYRKRSGACTRCEQPFGGNRFLAFMVGDEILWTIRGDLALIGWEVVAVCEACVTAKERATATRSVDCKGCGITMLSRLRWRGMTCSTRCAQRWLRQRRRVKNLICKTCGLRFERSRTDAKFCSNACRQKAHRLASAAG